MARAGEVIVIPTGTFRVPDAAAGAKVKVHLSIRGEKRPSLIEMKTFCSHHLPVYMIPDVFAFHESLPKTSTDKIDYQTLQNLVVPGRNNPSLYTVNGRPLYVHLNGLAIV